MPEPKKKAAAPPAPERVTVTANGDGTWLAVYPQHRYRFLFSDGSTADVSAARDDSDLRGAMLKACGAERIEGVARLA